MSIYRFIPLLLGIILVIASFIVPSITSATHVVDFTTLAQYISHIQLYLLGNILIWLAILAQPK